MSTRLGIDGRGLSPLLFSLLFPFLAACDQKHEVVHYSTAKRAEESLAQHPSHAAAPQDTPAPASTPAPATPPRKEFAHEKPANWRELPSSGMRVASFEVDGTGGKAEITVIPLGLAGGAALPNVNRWRGQAGLPPVTEEEMKKDAREIKIGGVPGTLYDLHGTGEGAIRILAAMVEQGEKVWFFKMSGPATVVGQETASFETFLNSVRWEKKGD